MLTGRLVTLSAMNFSKLNIYVFYFVDKYSFEASESIELWSRKRFACALTFEGILALLCKVCNTI